MEVKAEQIRKGRTDDRGRLHLGTDHKNCVVEVAILDSEPIDE